MPCRKDCRRRFRTSVTPACNSSHGRGRSGSPPSLVHKARKLRYSFREATCEIDRHKERMMSSNQNEIPAIAPNPLDEVAEKDTAGDPVKEILKEEGAIESKVDES